MHEQILLHRSVFNYSCSIVHFLKSHVIWSLGRIFTYTRPNLSLAVEDESKNIYQMHSYGSKHVYSSTLLPTALLLTGKFIPKNNPIPKRGVGA